MKSKYKFFFLILLFPFKAFSQSNYKPGYVIRLNGDTIRGYIDYREWDSNPNEIYFKSSTGNKSKKFTAHDIQLFTITGQETYQRYAGSISMDETNTANLISLKDSSFRIDTVFLKVLETGKNVSLFSYADKLKTRLYLGEQPDFVPVELVYKIYHDQITVIDDSYKKRLFSLANKYNVLNDLVISDIQNAGYVSSYILPIVTKINQISKIEYNAKYAPKSAVEFYIGAGANLTNTSTNTSSAYYAAGGRQYTSAKPMIALGLNFTPNASTARLQLRLEFGGSENQYSSSFKLTVSPYADVKASFNQFQIYLAPQIIFNFFNAANFKIYGGVGIAPTYTGYSNAAYVSRDANNSISNIAATDPFNFNSFDIPILLKAGLKINRNFEVFFNYITSTALTKQDYFQFNYTREQVGLYYFFGAK